MESFTKTPFSSFNPYFNIPPHFIEHLNEILLTDKQDNKSTSSVEVMLKLQSTSHSKPILLFAVYRCLYCTSLFIKTRHKSAGELRRGANEHTPHEHTPRGVRGRGQIFPSAPGTLITAESGCTGRRGGVGMWMEQHGGKILGLLASGCFLLISYLVVQHVQLTTTPRSATSAEWLCAEVSVIWQRGRFPFAGQGAR